MIDKLKNWLLRGVIFKKVLKKFVKGGVAALAGLAGTNQFLNDTGISIDWKQFETWAVVVLTGLFSSAWNYLDHRLIKKK